MGPALKVTTATVMWQLYQWPTRTVCQASGVLAKFVCRTKLLWKGRTCMCDCEPHTYFRTHAGTMGAGLGQFGERSPVLPPLQLSHMKCPCQPHKLGTRNPLPPPPSPQPTRSAPTKSPRHPRANPLKTSTQAVRQPNLHISTPVQLNLLHNPTCISTPTSTQPV